MTKPKKSKGMCDCDNDCSTQKNKMPVSYIVYISCCILVVLIFIAGVIRNNMLILEGKNKTLYDTVEKKEALIRDLYKEREYFYTSFMSPDVLTRVDSCERCSHIDTVLYHPIFFIREIDIKAVIDTSGKVWTKVEDAIH